MSKKAAPSDRVILKILSGTQSGAEVSLEPGEYSIGAGPDDDICLIDISLKPNHGKLRISPTTIELIGVAGGFTTQNGASIEADGEAWTELEPLEIVTAGTTRFALGPVHANWTSLTETKPDTTKKPASRTFAGGWLRERMSHWSGYAIALAIVAILAAVAVHQWNSAGSARMESRQASVAALRSEIDKLPFGHDITIREDVDGTIYASGYVETPTDRRAVAVAADRLGVPLRLRLNVLQSMRDEIDTMIAALKVPVTATLAKDGTVALEGLILNEDNARQLASRLKTDISGLSGIDNRIRTAKTLMVEIEKLAKRSQIDAYLVFRLDKQAVEVNGVLPVDKIDAWVGFLQAYSKSFAKEIALRSYVQLQANAAPATASTDAPATASTTTPVGPPISIGPREANSSDIPFDMERIRRGLYDLSDLFVGLKRKSTRPNQGGTAQAIDPKQRTGERGDGSQTGSPADTNGPFSTRQVDANKSIDAIRPTDAIKPADAADLSSRQMWQLTTADAGRSSPSAGMAPSTDIASGFAPDPAMQSPTGGRMSPQAGPSPASPSRSPSATAAPVGSSNQPADRYAPRAGSGTPLVDRYTPATSAAASSQPSRTDASHSAVPAPSAALVSGEVFTKGVTAGPGDAFVNSSWAATDAVAQPPRDEAGKPSDARKAVAPTIASEPGLGVISSGAPPPDSAATRSNAQSAAPALAVEPPKAAITRGNPERASTSGAGATWLKPELPLKTSSPLLAAAANRLITRWLAAGSGEAALPAPVQATLDKVAETRASVDASQEQPSQDLRSKYLPLIATDVPDGTSNSEACWPGSRLTTRNLPAAMFWLDVLSVSPTLSLKSFTPEEQRFLLEVAANPQRVRGCLADRNPTAQLARTSLYLNEALRNPAFVRFIARDLLISDIDVAGISLSGNRYIQTRDGNKHREGAAIDTSRRIMFVGEVATVLRSTSGYQALPYGNDVNWILSAN